MGLFNDKFSPTGTQSSLPPGKGQGEANDKVDHVSQDHLTIDPEVQKRVVRKLDTHVVPLVMALCKW